MLKNFKEKLSTNYKINNSILCIGLDPDLNLMPVSDITKFNKIIIDSTKNFACAYKPNLSFYEALGSLGIKALENTIDYIRETAPDKLIIGDGKRGDIGNTSNMYAKAFFQNLEFDSITISPYTGKDSVEPFLSFDNKYVFLLTLTSNSGSEDFQLKEISDTSNKLYEEVILKSKEWKNSHNIMYVVGAKNVKEISRIRKLVPNSYLLIPGVGAQGGSLKDICENGLDNGLKLLVNSSRSIIYSSSGEDYAEKAMLAAAKLQEEMEKYIIDKGII